MARRDQARSVRVTAGGVLLLALMTGLLCLVGRVAYIQQRMGGMLTAQAQRQQSGAAVLPSRRGFIFDSRGRVLAGTVTERVVFADPARIEGLAEAARGLAPVLGCQAGELRSKLEANRSARYVVLGRGATPEQAEAVGRLDIAGVGVEYRTRRDYSMQKVGAHVVGFVGEDGVGLEGAELAFNDYLAGDDGYEATIRDARRRAIWVSQGRYRAPRDGLSVVLTIDAVIQEIAERVLRETVARFEARAGCAVVLDPHNGTVLALANDPTYDPNWFADYPLSAMRNRAVTDPFEPGSTFKPFIASAAVSDGLVGLNEVFWCHEGYYAQVKLRDHHPYGHLTLREVVIKSSNIGMAVLGERLGQQRLHDTCVRFGFGRPTGIEMPGESAGIVRPLREWTRPDTTRVTMGQGPIATTPLQLARAFCAFVNGGRVLRLTMLRGVVDSAGQVVKEMKVPVVEGQALDPAAAEQFARSVLLDVVREGTGRQAALASWHVLGKTGTAQVPRPGGGYEPDGYISSFLGAAPASKARLVVVVAIHRPSAKLGYYGGTVAAPAVGEILRESLGYLGVPADKFDVEQARLTKGEAGPATTEPFVDGW